MTLATLLPALLSCPAARAQDAAPGEEEPPPHEEAGEVVVVTGTRTERPLSESVVVTDVITREQVLESGASDASEVLETVPGVEVVRSFRGAGVRMQGLDPQYVLILVDGKRVIGRRDGVVDLSRIPAERIERIEVVKGAASALYGSDAIGGVINIITRQPDQGLSSQAVASYGSRDTVDASETLGLRRESWAAGLSFGLHRTDGYDWDPSDEQTDGNAASQLSGEGDLDWKLSPAVRLLLDGGYRLRDSSGVDVVSAATFDRRNLTEDTSLRLGAELLPGQASKLSISATGNLFRDQYSLDQRGGSDLDVYEDSRELLGQLDAQWDQVLGGRQVLTLGGEGLRETLDSPRLSEPGERWRGAVFAQDAITLGPRDQLEVVPSARLDADSWFGLHPAPRLALRWDAAERLSLRINGGMGFRAPDFKEMFLLFENPSAGYQVQGNPDLRPETSLGLSGGVEAAPSRALTLRLDGWYTDLQDLITIDFVRDATASSPAAYSYVNVARAWTTGGEVVARLRLSRVLATDLGYTLTLTYDRDAARPLDGRAPHRGTFGLTARSPWLLAEATLRGEVVGPTRFYVDEDADGVEEALDTDPYANLKLRVEKTVLPRAWQRREGQGAGLPAGLRLFGGVDNLLNAGDALYIHLDPRLFYGGLVLDLPVPGGASP